MACHYCVMSTNYQAEAKNVYLNEMHIFMQSDSQGIMFFQQ